MTIGAITMAGGTISVKTAYEYRMLCKSVAGAKWNPNERQWEYKASPTTAREIDKKFGPNVTRDAAFVEYVKQANGVAKVDADIKAQDGAALPQPNTRATEAWGHQKMAYHFGLNKPALMLAMDMGTGKTKVTIDLIQNRGHERVLIVCPLKVVPVWPKEFEKHCKVPYQLRALDSGSTATRTSAAKALMDSHYDGLKVVVINYDAARNDPFNQWAESQQWDLVVADESHKIKKPGGVTSRFVSALGRRATNRMALTGTPLPHTPLDAYAQYRFLDPAIFGNSFAQFRARYAIMGGYKGYEILGYQNQDDFNERFYSIAVRIGKEVLDLPEYHHIVRTTRLSDHASRLYREMEDDFLTYLNGADEEPVTASNTLVKLLRLAQITGGYLDNVQVDTEKRDLLEDVLDEISEEEPVVVFCRFINDLDTVHEVATKLGRTSFELSGRKDEKLRWDNATVPGAVLAVQIQAGGVGIDLTKSRYSIYYSKGYSLGDYEQSLARIHRPGQTRTTTYIHLNVEGTIDETIHKALANKKQVVESILEELR